MTGGLVHNVRRGRVFDVMDLAHVAGNHQHLVGLKFHERRRRNETVHRHRAPFDLCQDIVHLFNARDALEGNARVEEALEINFVRVFLQKKNVLAHDESPDRVIDRRVIVVSLIDRELEQMFRAGSDRQVAIAYAALRFHRQSSENINNL